MFSYHFNDYIIIFLIGKPEYMRYVCLFSSKSKRPCCQVREKDLACFSTVASSSQDLTEIPESLCRGGGHPGCPPVMSLHSLNTSRPLSKPPWSFRVGWLCIFSAPLGMRILPGPPQWGLCLCGPVTWWFLWACHMLSQACPVLGLDGCS